MPLNLERTVMKNNLLLVILLCQFLPALSSIATTTSQPQPELAWPKVTKEHRPWTYWWWLGSAVDKPNLTEHLETYGRAGIGGVHIIPIYGVKGFEDRFIDYLSPAWMEMLRHTVKEAKRLGMGVDMSTGTGWPFGGPNVTNEDATAGVFFQTYTLDAAGKLNQPITLQERKYSKHAHLQAVMAFSDKGDILDLTDKVTPAGKLNWTPAAQSWHLYAVFQAWGRKQVERAAPAGAGNIVNPFSRKSLHRYLKRFDKAFSNLRGDSPRAQYHDSYEYGRAEWTDDFFEQFSRRRGYDLRRYLPALLGQADSDTAARVKSDYRRTIAELHLEEYITPWVQWAHESGFLTRNQAHGAPGNLLDLYAAADIPETEIFGPSGFDIPGLRTDPDFSFHEALNNPLMLKFASSAAHVTGSNLVSSESCTWLGEHFRVSLSQAKPEIDQLFVSGINHVFYHGMAYSPFDQPWPGWLFYASTNFAPSNSFWCDFPELNAYIARCQSVLQSGQPDNDVLVYWPIYDLWHNKDGMLINFPVHGISRWLLGSAFGRAANILWQRGYSFDYISDRQLTDCRYTAGVFSTKGGKYRVLVVPQCRFMPLRTLERLIDLAKAGATIIVHNSLPGDVPGLGNLQNRRKKFQKALAVLAQAESENSGLHQAKVGNGRFLIDRSLEKMLELAGVRRETVVDRGIRFIRRAHHCGHHYFLVNLSKGSLDDWVPLAVKAEAVVIFDPRFSDRQGIAALRRQDNGATEVYLQLQPGQACILRTFASRKFDGPKWRYIRKSDDTAEITGKWNVTFLQGGPELPAPFQTNTLASWTELGDAEAKRFAGTARYTIRFAQPTGRPDDWLLDLGRVCHSARVALNGRYVGALWSFPFQIQVGRFLREGENVLDVEVTNLSANRIADLDRRKVFWKKFYEINFVNIRYRPFDASNWPLTDSGLLGPVRLIPSTLVEPLQK